MTHPRTIIAVVSLGLGIAAAPLAAPAVAAPQPALVQPAAPAATPAARVGATPASASIEFDVGMKLGNAAGAVALARAVSDPTSPGYRRFLTPAQWESRFSPSESSVRAVTSWLASQGITVAGVTPDRLTIEASASAATIERAFGTSLGEYTRHGHTVRLASGALTAPASVAELISGITGIDQTRARPNGLTGAAVVRRRHPARKGEEIPQPEGFRNGTPCSSYYGEKLDTTDPAFGGKYPSPLPYAPCGYNPTQLQSAYSLTGPIASGITGKGVTVAVVDAFAAPTLYADAHRYSVKNQPGQVLAASQFSELLAKRYEDIEECEAPEWFGEQTLDVEAVHATAPGANILYVGAKNCEGALNKAVQKVVDGHLAQVVTDSWGDDGGDLLDSAGMRRSFDNVLLMAAGTGVGVQFSSGDEGDEFITLGITVPDYPPSSPYATAVGGTSLQVGKTGSRIGEVGWSTSKSVLCTAPLAAEEFPGCEESTVGTWTPKAPGEMLYGGGGGTSYEYGEPWYQEGVVPAKLAERNTAITGVLNRVEPDISMDADPTTGMLVGETQTFPDGVYYDQYRIGGTSLSSPLFAGVMADADQAAGGSLGFVNPLLYRLDATGKVASSAFYDVVPAAAQALVRVDFLDGVDAGEGTITSVRTLTYEGKETFCSGTGNCTHQKVAINTAPGFDSMTGIGTPGSGFLAALAKP